MWHMNYPKFSSILWHVKMTCLKEDKQIIELSDFLYFTNLKWDYLWNIIVWRLHMSSIQNLYVKIYISYLYTPKKYVNYICINTMQIYCLLGVKSTHFGRLFVLPLHPLPILSSLQGQRLNIGHSRHESCQCPSKTWMKVFCAAIRGVGDLDEGDVFEGKQGCFPWNHRVNMEMTIVWCFKKLAMMNILILSILTMTKNQDIRMIILSNFTIGMLRITPYND